MMDWTFITKSTRFVRGRAHLKFACRDQLEFHASGRGEPNFSILSRKVCTAELRYLPIFSFLFKRYELLHSSHRPLRLRYSGGYTFAHIFIIVGTHWGLSPCWGVEIASRISPPRTHLACRTRDASRSVWQGKRTQRPRGATGSRGDALNALGAHCIIRGRSLTARGGWTDEEHTRVEDSFFSSRAARTPPRLFIFGFVDNRY